MQMYEIAYRNAYHHQTKEATTYINKEKAVLAKCQSGFKDAHEEHRVKVLLLGISM
jgi:hypothetical protein